MGIVKCLITIHTPVVTTSCNNMSQHLKAHAMLVDKAVLEELGAYLAKARFQMVSGSNVCIDWQLGLKCHPVTAAMGIPGDRNVGAMRLQGSIERPLTIAKPTDLMLIQSSGAENPKVRDASNMEEVPLSPGTCVHVTKDVVLVVPEGAIIDFVFISESL